MPQKTIDNATGFVVATAPAWAPPLDRINDALTFVSLVLGIAFLLWRWWRAAKMKPGTRSDVL